jgi:hypothetical protein
MYREGFDILYGTELGISLLPPPSPSDEEITQIAKKCIMNLNYKEMVC